MNASRNVHRDARINFLSARPYHSTVLGLFLAAVLNISADVEQARKANNLPALSVSVVNAKGLVAHGAAGASTKDAFHIGSCTKPITATAIATLVEEGKLSWDRTIGDAFADWTDIRDEYRNVRLIDLLTHEGGIPPFEDEDQFKGAPDARTEFAHYVLTQPPVVPPRTGYKYSNAGFTIAAVMAERASGQPYEKLVEDRVFKPLRLKTAGFGWPAKVWGHEWKDGAWKAVDPHGPYQLGKRLAPAGDIHMSADDLAGFLRAHLRALRGERTLITPETAKFMHTKRMRSGAGFGIQKIGDIEPVSVYAGSADTFFTVFAIAPGRDVAVVVDTNAASDDVQKAVSGILKQMLTRFAAP
jgi:CubicO group peptidase (beta-lactamase class C family)